MIVAVPKETYPGERRVALVPGVVPQLVKKKIDVRVQTGAGQEAGYSDSAYEEKGASLVVDRKSLLADAQVILTVREMEARPDGTLPDLSAYQKGQAMIGFVDPLGSPEVVHHLSERGLLAFSMEMMPRITRAQSMDALSSMATIAGYKAVLLAADTLPRMFPLLMTAAGTVTAARVFVIGAGVAGLQAIASARRLGAVVQAYDVRPAVKEQVQSLGGKFVELPLEAGAAEDEGGYARALDEDFYRKQRELMARVVSESDVVITTAAVPGKKAPILITHDMVEGMQPGSVIVDLAAERGGNCEVTRPGETIRHGPATVLGPLNLPSTIPYHASQMYAKNCATFLLHLVKDGELPLDTTDEITRETLLTRDFEVVHARVRELLELPPLDQPVMGD